MPAKKYFVALTDEERLTLLQMLSRGKHSARKLTRARILLKAADGLDDQAIAEMVQTSQPTVERTRKRFAMVRLGALEESPRPGRAPILSQTSEARLIAEACSAAPEGRQRWTLSLLADRVVELKLADACSQDTVRRVLKKTNSSRGSNSNGASGRSAALSSPRWKRSWRFTPNPMMRSAQK
jgi:putative transposase